MDTKWFKTRQKQVGKTSFDLGAAINRDRTVISRILNGQQKMTFDQAQAFAEVLDVPLQDVLVRAGLTEAQVAQQIEPGFAEADAVPWYPREDGRDQDLKDMAATMKGGLNGVDVWRVKSSAMSLGGFMEGDFILVDHRAVDNVRAHDAVIAQVYDWQSGTSTTVLRRFEPPVLVAQSADREDWKVHVVDHNNVAIKGKVLSSWRVL